MLTRLIGEAERLFATERKLGLALKKIDKVLLEESSNTEALVVKGRILFNLDRVREALNCFDQAILIDAFCADAFLERARILYAVRQEHNKALDEVRTALACSRRDLWTKVEAYRLQGDILCELDEDDEAVASYRSALRLDPQDADSRCALGTIFLTNGQPAKALRELDRALRIINSKKVLDQLNLGFAATWKAEALNSLGRYSESLRVIDVALKRVRRGISREGLQALRGRTHLLLHKDNLKVQGKGSKSKRG